MMSICFLLFAKNQSNRQFSFKFTLEMLHYFYSQYKKTSREWYNARTYFTFVLKTRDFRTTLHFQRSSTGEVQNSVKICLTVLSLSEDVRDTLKANLKGKISRNAISRKPWCSNYVLWRLNYHHYRRNISMTTVYYSN